MFTYNEVFKTEPKDFTENFKEFCLSSLITKFEVVKAIHDIKSELNKVKKLSIFETGINQPTRLEEFKNIQEVSSNNTIIYLKGNYINEITKIIKEQFSDVEKGWFSVKESGYRSTYDVGKLKRLFYFQFLKFSQTSFFFFFI